MIICQIPRAKATAATGVVEYQNLISLGLLAFLTMFHGESHVLHRSTSISFIHDFTDRKMVLVIYLRCWNAGCERPFSVTASLVIRHPRAPSSQSAHIFILRKQSSSTLTGQLSSFLQDSGPYLQIWTSNFPIMILSGSYVARKLGRSGPAAQRIEAIGTFSGSSSNWNLSKSCTSKGTKREGTRRRRNS